MKRSVVLATSAFIISLLFLLTIAQATYGTVIETRRNVLVNALAKLQLDGFGAFHFVVAVPQFDYFTESGTAATLETIKTLDALDRIDIDSATDYIASKQHPTSGGFGTFVGPDGTIRGFDLYTTYKMVRALKEFDALHKINQTALLNFALARYNQSNGAFSEPITEANGKKYAVSWFALAFRSGLDLTAYAIPNVITTFSGVSLLRELDALNLINTTKTFDFIMSTKSSNGLFKPYPMAEQENLPSWSSLLTNPFDVDKYGTGIPYTYAAVSALKSLGRLDALNQTDRERITQYILDCQASNGNFIIHKDFANAELSYTVYAVMTLIYIEMQDQAETAFSRVQNHVLDVQQLALGGQWPFPNDFPYYSPNQYGTFWDFGADPLSDTIRAVILLNATNGLALLDQPTPRAYVVFFNIILASSLITGAATIALLTFNKLKKRKMSRESTEASVPSLPTQNARLSLVRLS